MVDQLNKSQTKEPIAKLLIIGDSKVGKSSILTRFTENSFSQHTITTIGIDYKTKRIDVDGTSIKLQIWDTAGQEKYRSITQNFYKNTMGVIVAFDLTEEQSFDNIRNWLRQIKTHAGENVCKILVGNKCDMVDSRAVTKDSINQFIKEIGIEYYEVSAKENINVSEAFYKISKNVKDKFFGNVSKNASILSVSNNTNNSIKISNSNNESKQKNENEIGNDNVSKPKCC